MDTIPELTQFYQALLQSQQSNYEQLIQSQQSNFYWLLAVFVVLIIFFIGASWFFNVKIAKEQLRSETKKIFDETNKLIDDLKEKFESEKNLLWGEIYRAFYISILDDGGAISIANRIFYAAGCIKYYSLANQRKNIKRSIEAMLFELESAIDRKYEFNKVFKAAEYDYNNILGEIDLIPDNLYAEKKEIQQLIEELKKEDGKKEKRPLKTKKKK